MSTEIQKQTFLPAPVTFEDAWRTAKILSASDLVPKDYRDKPENCLVAMQWGADIGLSGLQALQNIAVINGRPSIWGDAAKALVLVHPDCDDIVETLEGEGDMMTAVCTVKRRGKSQQESRFSVSDAKKANLWGKAGPWTNYPKRMLQMRARGFALRDAFPDALRGLMIAEEAQDYKITDITPATETPTIAEVKTLPIYSDMEFLDKLEQWRGMVESGKATTERIISNVETKYALTTGQTEMIKGLVIKQDVEEDNHDEFLADMEAAE